MYIVYKAYLVSKKQNLWFSTESVESKIQPSPLGSWSGAIHSVGVHEEQTDQAGRQGAAGKVSGKGVSSLQEIWQ